MRRGNCDRTLRERTLSGRAILTLELAQKRGYSFRVIRVLTVFKVCMPVFPL